MLRAGASVNEAVARGQKLVGIDDAVETARSVLSDALGAGPRTSTERKTPVTADQASAPIVHFGRRPQRSTVIDSPRRCGLSRQHWMDMGRPISAETLRQRLHVGADISRGLIRAVRAADRAAVIAAASTS